MWGRGVSDSRVEGTDRGLWNSLSGGYGAVCWKSMGQSVGRVWDSLLEEYGAVCWKGIVQSGRGSGGMGQSVGRVWDSLLEECGTVFGGGGGGGMEQSVGRLHSQVGGGEGLRQPGGSVDGDGKFAVYLTVGWSVWMEVAFFSLLFFFFFFLGGWGEGG